jgi:transposase
VRNWVLNWPMSLTPDTACDQDPGEALALSVAETIACLQAEKMALQESLAAAQEAIAPLTARVAERERPPGLNRRNSGKPPSCEGLKKPPRTTRLREPAGKKPGGQPGHQGETRCQGAALDVPRDHDPSPCASCGLDLPPDPATAYRARPVCDLPEPRPRVVTEPRAPVWWALR